MALAVALLAASCSQDELPEDGGDTPVTGQTQTYTFTASPDIVMEGEAETRTPTATTDDQPTRCFMQVYDAAGVTKVTDPIAGTPGSDNYSFTVQLASNTEYTYLFWADNAETEITDLTAVSYTAGTIAFACSTTGTPEEVIGTTVNLKHAVTKLTLQTTTETSAEAGEAVRVTATCASSYNVANPANSTFSSQTAEKVFEAATDIAANQEVATFYFIPGEGEQSVDVEFHLLKQTIESVPLAANTHVTLQGDLSESSSKWGNPTSAYIETKFQSYFFNENDQPKGYNSGYDENYHIDNATNESVIALFKEITRSNSFQLPGVGSEAIISNNLSITPMFNNDIYIFYKNTIFVVYLQNMSQDYPDFSSIYPRTNIN